MAQGWSTGAVDCWVGVEGQGGPIFLGHASGDGFQIEMRPQFEPLMCDIAGTKVPYDRAYEGFDAVLTGTLARWNENIYATLQFYPNSKLAGQGAISRGTDPYSYRGILMATSGFCYPIWLRYPNSLIAPFTGLPRGYHFLACMMESDTMRPGAKPYGVQIGFYAQPIFFPATGNFVCYDTDMSALSPGVPN